MALIKCIECGKEISDKAEACPHCGCPTKFSEDKTMEQYEINDDKDKKGKIKNKKIKLWMIICGIITIFAIVIFSNVLPNDFSHYDWNEVKLNNVLPEPASKWGKLSSNSNDYLYLYIHRTSLDDYNSYVSACADKGFNIETEKGDSSYIAFNSNGYKLNLDYYSNDKKIVINVDAPIEMTTIQWANSDIAKLLPIPKSTIGKIEQNEEKEFSVYLGNTPYSELNTYVEECESKGFTVDFQKKDKSFTAKNKEGYQLNVQYKGCNVIYISIIEPQRTLNLSFRSFESEFEFSVYIDDSWNLDVEKEKTKSCDVLLGMGEHIIKVRSDNDWNMYDTYVINVTKDENIYFDVCCTQNKIEIDLSGKVMTEDIIDNSEDDDVEKDNNNITSSEDEYSNSNNERNNSNDVSSSKNSGKLSDSEIEDLAVQTLYKQLLAYENNYHSIDAASCKYKINKIERDNGSVEIYGVVYFYNKHGSAVKFGGSYQSDFTVHTTEWGGVPWCEI